ncbi:Transcription elongation factor A N-terminal and central domain-containing protein, partial [Ophiophagus hannah]
MDISCNSSSVFKRRARVNCMEIASEFAMSDRSIIMTTAGCIENLLHKKNYQDIGSHLDYLETVDMTINNLQETDIAKAVFQILKNCPSVILKNKSKHLLSKWKTLYKKYQSMHIKPGASDMEVSFRNDQVVLENRNFCEKDQLEKVDSVSSNNCLPSENSSKAVRSNVQEDYAIQSEHLGISCLDSKINPPGDPITPLRSKCVELLDKALHDSSTSNEQNEKHHKIAEEIEQHIFVIGPASRADTRKEAGRARQPPMRAASLEETRPRSLATASLPLSWAENRRAEAVLV